MTSIIEVKLHVAPATRQIFNETADLYQVNVAELIGPSRRRRLLGARRYLSYRLRDERGLSTTQIGNLLHRDHTTILHYLHHDRMLGEQRDRAVTRILREAGGVNDRDARETVELEHIRNECAAKHGISTLSIMSRRKSRDIVLARHEALWRSTMQTTCSLPRIGRYWGLDHTTVLQAMRSHQRRLDKSGTVRKDVVD